MEMLLPLRVLQCTKCNNIWCSFCKCRLLSIIMLQPPLCFVVFELCTMCSFRCMILEGNLATQLLGSAKQFSNSVRACGCHTLSVQSIVVHVLCSTVCGQ